MPSKETARLAAGPAHGASRHQVVDLLCQALEAETGGARVYEAAIRSAQHPALKELWASSLARSRRHARVLRRAFTQLGVEPDAETAGREAVRRTQGFLAESIEESRGAAGTAAAGAAAQLVAAECVALSEARADALWLVVRGVAKALAGERGRVLQEACARAPSGPRTAPWARELWLQAIGLPATLPPPEAAPPAAPALGSRPTRPPGWGTPPW